MIPFILVAEDEPFLREIIQLGLEEHNAKVQAVSNGDDAILAIREQTPDMLLLDLLMPKRDGYGVLQYLREAGSTFPVIILSNVSDELNQEKSTQLGAVDFLVKSDLDDDELWPIIMKYLK